MITLRYSHFSPEDVEKIRYIFNQYALGLGIDLSFQNFEHELQILPDLYGSPTGCVILAEAETGQVVGCVALKPLKEFGVCEMKRMFVDASQRGTGLGRKLAQEVISYAKQAGYHTMKLDSLERLTSAVRLYESLGFVTTEPYVFNPMPEAVYLKLDLQ